MDFIRKLYLDDSLNIQFDIYNMHVCVPLEHLEFYDPSYHLFQTMRSLL